MGVISTRRRLVVAGAVAAFCLYRLSSFSVQPLDAPGTLRPILLRGYMEFLFAHRGPEDAIMSWRLIAIGLLLLVALLAIANHFVSTWPERLTGLRPLVRSRALFFSSAAVALFVCRYRTLLEPELNPDEGQFIAAAHKLFLDPVFFRSVDVGTSGPLNVFPLMSSALFGFSPDYASARLVMLGLTVGSLWFMYRTLVRLSDDESASRLAVVPAVGWFSILGYPDLVHFSSEQVPLFLTAWTMYACAGLVRDPHRYRGGLAWFGFIASATLLAKLQALPIVLAIGGVGALRVWVVASWRDRLRAAGACAAGAAPLMALVVASCMATGVWDETVFTYVLANASYQGAVQGAAMADFVGFLVFTGEARLMFFWFVGMCVAFAYLALRRWTTREAVTFIEIALVYAAVIVGIQFVYSSQPRFDFATIGQSGADLIRQRWQLLCALVSPAIMLVIGAARSRGRAPLVWFGAAAVAALAAAVFSIYAAHRLFPHYVALLFVPVCAAAGWMAIQRSRALLLLAVGVALFWQTQSLWSHGAQAFASVRVGLRAPEGDVIGRIGTPGSPITVWGWTVAPYLGSGRPPATRDTNMANFFRGIPRVDTFYRERFLRDLQRARPEVFVDAIGPESLAFHDRAVFGFEQIPPIAEYIKANYVLVQEISGERIYARRDVADRAGMGPLTMPEAGQR